MYPSMCARASARRCRSSSPPIASRLCRLARSTRSSASALRPASSPPTTLVIVWQRTMRVPQDGDRRSETWLLGQQPAVRFGADDLPDPKVQQHLVALLLPRGRILPFDLDHAAADGLDLEAGAPVVDAEVVHEVGVVYANEHRAAWC